MESLLEVNFTAYVTEEIILLKDYIERCRIAFSRESFLYNMKIYVGLSYDCSVWEKELSIISFKAEELFSEKSVSLRAFDITFFLLLEKAIITIFWKYLLYLSEMGEIFNNRGLNYCYKL